MNDNFHEQLITKKQKGNPLVIRIIVVVFIILFLTIGALFLGFLSIISAVVPDPDPGKMYPPDKRDRSL